MMIIRGPHLHPVEQPEDCEKEFEELLVEAMTTPIVGMGSYYVPEPCAQCVEIAKTLPPRKNDNGVNAGILYIPDTMEYLNN